MSGEFEFALEKLADDSRPVRGIDLSSLSDLSRQQVDLLRAVWAGLDPERRLELVETLVEQAEANVHLHFSPLFRAWLSDPDAHVRKAAVDGLWEDSRVNLIPSLVKLLMEDESPEVRAAAAMSLGRYVLLGELGEISEMHARQAFAALQAAWVRSNEQNEVRRRALEGMAYTSSAPVLALIHSAYYDDDPRMRRSAVFAMGRSAERRWNKLVLGELTSTDAGMRFEAATAAGELGLTAAVQPLIRLLEDADSEVREAAAMALGKIGGKEARRALEACVASDDARLAEAAEEALEELTFNSGSLETPLLPVPTRPTAKGAEDLSDGDENPDEELNVEIMELLAEDFALDEDDLDDDDLGLPGFLDEDEDDDLVVSDEDDDWDQFEHGLDDEEDVVGDEDWDR
jgi:HEAT repeat protein